MTNRANRSKLNHSEKNKEKEGKKTTYSFVHQCTGVQHFANIWVTLKQIADITSQTTPFQLQRRIENQEYVVSVERKKERKKERKRLNLFFGKAVGMVFVLPQLDNCAKESSLFEYLDQVVPVRKKQRGTKEHWYRGQSNNHETIIYQSSTFLHR
jgi:hypothetical protein